MSTATTGFCLRPPGVSRARWAEAFHWIRTDHNPPKLLPFRRKKSQRALRRKVAEVAKRAASEHYAPHMILLKGRRIKATTEWMNEAMAACCTEPYYEAVFAAQTQPDAIKLLRMAHLIYDKLPEGVRPKRRGDNKAEFDFFELGSYLTTGTAGAMSLARGGGLQFGVDDEAAWSLKGIEDREQWYTGLREALRRGMLISQSTPRPHGWFRWKFEQVMEGKFPGVYPLIMTHWEDDDNRVPLAGPEEAEQIYCTLTDEEKMRAAGAGFDVTAPQMKLLKAGWEAAKGAAGAVAEVGRLAFRAATEVWERIKWRRLKWATLGRLAPQEYVEDPITCWVALGLHFYDPDVLARHLMVAKKNPPIRSHEEGTVLIWEEFQPNDPYLITTDSSEGGAQGDQCVSALWNARTGAQAGEVWGKWRAHEFARKTNQYLGRPYGYPTWAIERGGPGYAVIEAARVVEDYPNLYQRQSTPDKMTGLIEPQWGWDTNPVTRPVMLEDSREALATDAVKVYSERLLGECAHFKLKEATQRYEAEKGAHDEGPIVLAMGVHLLKTGAVLGPTVEWV